MSRRMRWHRQIGTRLEVGYGPQARDFATELAAHFVRGWDTSRAVPYLRYAGESALQRSAQQEAMTHITQGLALLQTLPDSSARTQQEITHADHAGCGVDGYQRPCGSGGGAGLCPGGGAVRAGG